MDSKKVIGRRLRAARIERGWSREFVANKAGVGVSTIGSIECGRRSMTVDVAAKIADFLGWTIDKLVGHGVRQ